MRASDREFQYTNEHESDLGWKGMRWLNLGERDSALGILFIGELGSRLDIRQPNALVIVHCQSLHAGKLPGIGP